MEKIGKKRAVELLIQEVDKIPYLKTLPSSNDEFRLWLKNVENIISVGLEPEDKNKYQEASQFLKYLRGAHEEDLVQQDYIDEIVRYEIALKSIIQKYEILGTESENVSQRLLNDIFSEFIKSPDGLDALRFRADNRRYLSEIDQLENSNFIQRKGGLYFIMPLTLAQLSQQNPKAQELIRLCSLVFGFLHGVYIDNPGQRVTFPDLSRGTGLPPDDLRIASRIIIQMPILRGYNIHPVVEKAFITPSENILKYNSFEDLLDQMQKEAEKLDIQPSESAISDTESPEYPVEQSARLSESRANWQVIRNEFGVTKNRFGRKINFVSDSFKRKIIFRDVEHAFVLASSGFSKPAVILAGSVIEELLRLYLKHKNISPIRNDFDGYIQTCEQRGLLKDSISRLSHVVRQFRNLVHLSREESSRDTISKATAKGAVSSIFTIANDF